MKFVPRVLTDGRAVALGGYIHRVNDDIVRETLSVPSASSSFGGSATSKPKPFRSAAARDGKRVVTFGSAEDKAWHDRPKVPAAGNSPEQTVHAQSTITRLAVGNRLFLDRAAAHLKTVYRSSDGQPTITPLKAEIKGLVIDGVRFTVSLGTKPIASFGTCDLFHRACQHGEHFHQTHGNRVLSFRDGRQNGQADKGCYVYSLVDRITWKGKLPEGAEVSADSHVIVWPDFGKVILGEMLIADFSRRLTMVRLELGSPIEARLAIGDVQSGGQGLP
jgi:hypothetical protein